MQVNQQFTIILLIRFKRDCISENFYKATHGLCEPIVSFLNKGIWEVNRILSFSGTNREESSSPIPPMSPETQNLFDILCEDETVTHDDQESTLITAPYILGAPGSVDSCNTDLTTPDDPLYSPTPLTSASRNIDPSLQTISSEIKQDVITINSPNILETPGSVDSCNKNLPTPDAPLYSPLTPASRNINRSFKTITTEKTQDVTPAYSPKNLAEPFSVDSCNADLLTPDAPLYSPITPVCHKPVQSADQNISENDFSSDDSVEDPDYCNSFHNVVENVQQNNNGNITAIGRPKKGRKRKFAEYTLSERKNRKYNNLPYQGRSNAVMPKIYKEFNCSCVRKCFLLVSNEKREAEFLKYTNIGSYEAQLMYIVSNVKETSTKRKYVCTNTKSEKRKPRKFSRSYNLSEVQVCKAMFTKTLQISSQKLTISLTKN